MPFNPNVKDGRCTEGLAINKSNWATTLTEPPFTAYAVTCGITFTFGGLRINTDAQVLDTDLRAVPGLYAAGELIGGIFYNNYPGGTGFDVRRRLRKDCRYVGRSRKRLKTIDRRGFLTSAALGLGALGLGVARGQPADFAGQIIELVIPFKEGGGSDTWGRFNAPFLSRYLPGQPTVIVRNVPGGNSIAGANRYAARARPDGLSVLGTSASTQFPYLLEDPRVTYDYRDWRVLMASGTGGVAYVAAELGIASAAELHRIGDRQLLYGSQGPTSLDLVPVLGLKLLGLNVRPIFGMSGRGAGRLAFERGEINTRLPDDHRLPAQRRAADRAGQRGAAVLLGRAG